MSTRSPGRGMSTFLWILAFLLMLGAGVYQRLTGPTHPLRGSFEAAGEQVRYRLIRAEWTDQEAVVRIPAADGLEGGTLVWRRYPTADPWIEVPMARDGEDWAAPLPIQPPAGKVEYHLDLTVEGRDVRVPDAADGDVILRYRDPVPLAVLIPHIMAMFVAVMIAWRAGLGALVHPFGLRGLAWWALGLFTVGGMILGPIVQKYAFGEYWTGIPFGWDLTDNKTLVMWVAWIVAAFALERSARRSEGEGLEAAIPGWGLRTLVLLASVVTVFVYLIPHSVQGSELDYDAIDRGVPAEEAIGIG